MTPARRIRRIQRWIGESSDFPDAVASHPYTSPDDKEELYDARTALAQALMIREIEWLTNYALLNLGPVLPREFDTDSLQELYSNIAETRTFNPAHFDYPDI